MSLNLLRNVFLSWKTYAYIKEISENSSQNKIYLAKKNFYHPFYNKVYLKKIPSK